MIDRAPVSAAAPAEIDLAADGAEVDAAGVFGADLPEQVDLERGVDRDQRAQPGKRAGSWV